MTGEGRGCVTEDMIMWIKTNGLAQPMYIVPGENESKNQNVQ